MGDSLDVSSLYRSVKLHEGYRSVAYLDHLGYLTVGIGHRVTSTDNIKLNEKISIVRIKKFFNDDIHKAFNGAKTLLLNFESHPRAVKNILTEMVFQLGRNGVSKFKKTLSLINAKDYPSASIEMLDSKWYKQTPSRAKALSDIMSRQRPLVLGADDNYILHLEF